MTIHPQDLDGMLGRGPGGTPVNTAQLNRIREVLNDARADQLHPDGQPEQTHDLTIKDHPLADPDVISAT